MNTIALTTAVTLVSGAVLGALLMWLVQRRAHVAEVAQARLEADAAARAEMSTLRESVAPSVLTKLS